MGVQGLWALLEPAGKPIPLETLENKVLAIDVSIWLNQAVKGIRDQEGGTVANAHILGLFHRICKLLFYKIRPIFVFDGKAPQLKRDTLRKRHNTRSNMIKKSDAVRAKILNNFMKRNAVASQLQRQTFAVTKALEQGQEGLMQMIQQRAGNIKTGSEQRDLFELPPLPQQGFGLGATSQDDSSDDEDDWKAAAMGQLDVTDIHSIDLSSQHFKSLPTEIQFELLADLKEKRKLNSWNKMSEMPRKADAFSGFQMERLVKRHQIQKKFCEVGRQLGQDAVEGLDASLFVGDKQGLRKNLKQELKRVASSQDGAHVMFVSGLNDRTLEGADISQDDIHKISKMEKSGNVSTNLKQKSNNGQQSKHIGSSNVMSSDSDWSGSEDSSFDILEPSSQGKSSNRIGGMRMKISLDIPEQPSTSKHLEHIKSNVELSFPESKDSNSITSKSDKPIEIHIPIPDDEYMSTSEESDDDMFADVFTNPNDVINLDKILQGTHTEGLIKNKNIINENTTKHELIDQQEKSRENSLCMTPITAKHMSILEDAKEMSKSNKDYDVYAQITQKAKTKAKRTSYEGIRENDFDNIGEEIVDSMKNSDQIWLKKASKWVQDKVGKPPETLLEKNIHPEKFEAVKNVSPAQKPSKIESLLDWERKQLVNELNQREREDRLIKIKKLSDANNDATQKDKGEVPKLKNEKGAEDDSLLGSLGVHRYEKSEIERHIMENEGWFEDNDKVNEDADLSNKPTPDNPSALGVVKKGDNDSSVVYGDSVEGFVTTNKYKVVETSKQEHDSPDSGPRSFESILIEKATYDKLNYDNDETQAQNELTEKELFTLQQKLAQEQQLMVAEQKKVERFAATLTDQMYQECQQLLQLFGIPWIVSPGEAEAQCAFLDEAGLSNGIITDDSDVWVFGGKNVFKNFFDRDKYCESFSLNEITKHFGLDREKMIQVALLTGSDYTEGILDIGPVTSMEILAEFPGSGIDSLTKFSQWWKEINGNTKVEGKIVQVSKTREKFKRFQLPKNFPSKEVFDAYMNPIVDTSTEKFSWAVPNFVALRDYTYDKFGWTKGKTDQILKPVIRKMTSTGENAKFQSRIDNFFQSERTVLPKKGSKLESSKRVKEAIEKVLNKEGTSQGEASTSKPNKRLNNKVEKKNNCKKETKSRSNGKKSTKSTKQNDEAQTPLQPQFQPSSQSAVIDQKMDDNEKKAIAKQKAIEIYKKSQKNSLKKTKVNKPKPPKVSKLNKDTAKRKVLAKHGLSESDDDDD